jgi:hypothetical protein
MRFIDRDYAELLGFYLGDGCISDGAGRNACGFRWTPSTQGSLDPRETSSGVASPNNPVDLVSFHMGPA